MEEFISFTSQQFYMFLPSEAVAHSDSKDI